MHQSEEPKTMASAATSFLAFTIWVLLTSPALSLTCTSQNLTSVDRKPYANCLDLPVLESYIHYTYNASNSSLSVAFVAAPAKPGGWIAWAVNPTDTGMVGAQSILAFAAANGSLVVKTFNLSSYSDIREGKLSFRVWNLRAESTGGGKLAIHATVEVPAGAGSVNQVWQVGEKVTADGHPKKHAFAPPNLSSKGVLKFGDEAKSPVQAPAAASGAAGETAAKNGGISKMRSLNVGAYLVLLVSAGSLFIF